MVELAVILATITGGMTAVLVVRGIVVLIVLLLLAQFFSLWLQAYMRRAGVSLGELIGMRLRKVDMRTNVRYEEITDKGLVISSNDGERRLIEADTIVLALGVKTDTELANRLKGKVTEIHLAGDCVEPYGLREAIASGSRVARRV